MKIKILLLTFVLILSFLSCKNNSNSDDDTNENSGISRSDFVAHVGTYNYSVIATGKMTYDNDVYAYISGSENGVIDVTGLTPSSVVTQKIDFVKFSYSFTDYTLYSSYKTNIGDSFVSGGITYKVTYDYSTYTATFTNITTTTRTFTYADFLDSLFPKNNSVKVTENTSGSVIYITKTQSNNNDGVTVTITENTTARLQ